MYTKEIPDHPTTDEPSPALAPLWNVQELLNRVDGDLELFRELLLMFNKESQDNLTIAVLSLRSNDHERLARAAHTLQGMLKNLAMIAPAEIAASLEEAARAKDHSQASAQVLRLQKALLELAREVEVQLAGAHI